MWFIVLFSACSGCRPELSPPADTDRPPEDSTPPIIDSGDSSPVVDTGPPPLCPVVEVEPDDALEQALALPLQTWACGEFSYFLDTEWLTVTPNQSAEQTSPQNTPWMTIQVDAASRGSSANPQLLVSVGDDSVIKYGDYLTSDPRLVFPVARIEPYSINLAESDLLYGEDYGWFLMASLDKAPVSWDCLEVEEGDDPCTAGVVETIDNDEELTAQDFPLGQRVFGTIGAPGDFDWYKVTVTDVGEVTLIFDVDAYAYGSAADITLWIYDAFGNEPDMKPNGPTSADLDPWLQKKVAGPAEFWVRVRDQNDLGSRFHWYTLSVTATLSE